MTSRILKFLTASAAFSLFYGCSYSDGSDIPLAITAYHVYLFDKDKAPNGDHYAGSVETSYLSRNDNLQRARRLALSEATRLRFDTSNNRYYIICTGTNESRCVTKIR